MPIINENELVRIGRDLGHYYNYMVQAKDLNSFRLSMDLTQDKSISLNVFKLLGGTMMDSPLHFIRSDIRFGTRFEEV